MRITKSGLIGFVCLMTLINSCLAQTGKYRDKIRPNIKTKIDSLYPHGTTEIVYNDKYVTDSTQEIEVTCHCDETEGMIILVFDTNANLKYKEVHIHSLKNLPDTIAQFVQKNTATNVKFFNEYIKCINNKGEVSYGIYMEESVTAYILKFKSSGELISKEEMPTAGQ